LKLRRRVRRKALEITVPGKKIIPLQTFGQIVTFAVTPFWPVAQFMLLPDNDFRPLKYSMAG
jgi:hypothetical protein